MAEQGRLRPRPVANPLILRGRGYLGVAYVDRLGGVRLTKVVPGSAASAAGLRPGDVIRAFNKTPASVATLRPFLVESRAGTSVQLQVQALAWTLGMPRLSWVSTTPAAGWALPTARSPLERRESC